MSVTVFPAASTGGASKTQKTIFITSTQSWTAPADVTEIELMLVAGGGGGGGAGSAGHAGGGGGGGGVLFDTVPVTAGTSYTVTIGAGGSAGSGSSTPGGNGSNSTFGSLRTSYGGGGGYSSGNVAPTYAIRASGGGLGTTSGSSGFVAGSGGGAFQYAFIDTYASNTPNMFELGIGKQGTPGTGQQTRPITGNPGINGYGAGGGGGTGWNAYNNPIMGGLNAGDGANGQGNTSATTATANRGGGGGGASGWNGYPSSAGGSGICIIKYWS